MSVLIFLARLKTYNIKRVNGSDCQYIDILHCSYIKSESNYNS